MAGVNFAILLGHVGRDPEIRSTTNGGKVASFSLATSEQWKDRVTGEKKERTEWHQVVVFSEGLVGVVERYVRKGSKLFVKGPIRTRKWQDRDGNDRYTTEIVLSGFDAQIQLLDSQGSGRPPPADEGSYGGGSGGGGAAGPGSGASDGWGAGSGDLDDEVPF